MDDMTLLQAIQFARSRKVLLPADYYSLDLTSRQYASTVSYLAGLDQIQSVLSSAYKVLEDGGTFRDFQKLVEENGIELSEAHLDNVFRTNIQNAYAHGRWLHQQKNKDKRSYLEYMAINDSRTRPVHLLLDGIVRHIDDPFWQKYYPPNGYHCRCGANALSEKQAQKKGITPDDKLPDVQPDKGWSFQPSNYDAHPDTILKSRQDREIGDQVSSDALVREIAEQEVESSANEMIKKTLTDVDADQLGEMVEKTIKLDPNVRPSDLVFTLGLSSETDNKLTELLKLSAIQKDQAGTVGKSIWDKVTGAFDRLFNIAKNAASKLTGNSIRGIDGLNLNAGNIIGIQTPTLFKQAEKAGKQITILDAKGIAIDLNKISGLNGALLAPDLNLEVVSNADDLLVLKRTDQKASRYFIADQAVISLY